MATPVTTNVFAATAQLITVTSQLSQQEEIFATALGNTKQHGYHAKLGQSLQAEFNQAQNCEDLMKVLERHCKSHKTWSQSNVEGLLQKAGRLGNQVMEVKDFMNGLVMINQPIGGPIWGTMMIAFTLLQNMVESKEMLDEFRLNVQDSVTIYANIGTSGRPLPDHLKNICVTFNEVVLQFYLLVIRELSHSRSRSIYNAVSKDFYQQLKSLLVRFDNVARSVHRGLSVDLHKKVEDVQHAQAFRPAQPNMTAQPLPTTRTRKICVPDMLSTAFTGRSTQYSQLTRCLSMSNALDYQRCVLFGIPGVGKSQLAMFYASKTDLRKQLNGYEYILFAFAHDKQSLARGMAQIGDELGLFDGVLANCDQALMAHRVKQWLRTNKRWLFIIDNVSNSSDLNDYLPGDGEGHVLITTRSKVVAHALTLRSNVIEVPHLDDQEGSNLVLALSSMTVSATDEDMSMAQRIVRFTYGLPLAIEQLVNVSESSNLGWRRALELIENRSALLKQRNFCTNHELNLSVGAILSTSLELLEKESLKASSLFRMLVYFDFSSVPLSLLRGTVAKLTTHFARQHTYDLGLDDTRDLVPSVQHNKKKEFFLFEYDPYELQTYVELFHRAFRRSKFGKVHATSPLPRVDSSSDIELANLWTSSHGKALQEVLADDIQIDNALTVLDKFGVLRRTQTTPTVWIHDLFAELTQALNQEESMSTANATAQLAATMVYLQFPIPATGNHTRKDVYFYLPHALATLRHLEQAQILNDATIGAELSCIVAGNLEWAGESSRSGGSGSDTILKYYRCAFVGYFNAWQRLLSVPKMTPERAYLWTYLDFEEQVCTSSYNRERWFSGYERFGRSAPWRCLQSMFKLALLLMYLKQHDEALSLTTTLIGFYSEIFGPDQDDSLQAVELSMNLYRQKQEWEKAYKAAIRMAEGFMGLRKPRRVCKLGSDRLTVTKERMGLVDSESGGQIALHCGTCAVDIPGKEKEALFWFRVYLQARIHIYGQNSKYCQKAYFRVAQAYEKLGDLTQSIFYLSRAVEVGLSARDIDASTKVGQSKWEAFMQSDSTDDEVTAEFRRVKTKIEAEGIELDHELGYQVELAVLQADIWDVGRPEIEDGPFTERVFLDEEYEPFVVPKVSMF